MNEILILTAVVIVICIVLNKISNGLGIPMLLGFIVLGMVFGSDGILKIQFDNFAFADYICSTALIFIMFYGGFGTNWSEAKPIAVKAVSLSTLGVVLTAGFVGLFCHYVFKISFLESMLIGSLLASTDAASVFSILRSKRLNLKYNTASILEIESGSNDPMAYILTILLVGLLTPGQSVSFGMSSLWFVVGMTFGVLAGYGFGRLAVWTINRINIENQSLYAVLLLAFVFLTFSVTDLIRGNGYLAVYVAGLVVGNYPIVHKKTLGTFFDGFTWLFQVILFVTLGLLVNIDELLQPEVLLLGTLTGLFMIFIARPAAVFLTLLPFRQFTTRARFYVSWVGLRGAVPIIFATYPVVAGVEDSSLLFNIVFFVTLLSLALQGTTVSLMAEWLGLAYPERERIFNDEVMNRMLDDATTELTVTEAMLEPGHHLRDIVLPAATLVVMVARDGTFFVPKGNSVLRVGDKLLVVTENKSEVKSVVQPQE